jgi:hypothetical protein
MEFMQSTFLTPYNYFDWKQNILHLLRRRGLYQITMATKIYPTSTDEKSHFLNMKDMGFRLIILFVSLERQFHVESLLTPDEVWTKLEVLFGIKEEREEFMMENAKTNPVENPPEEQASWLPPKGYLKDDASFHSDNISDLIYKSYSEDLENVDVEIDQRPKWEQSILSAFNYHMDDPVHPRRMRSQFEGDPHMLTTIEPILHIHFYIIMASNPQAYATNEGNPYWKTSMNEGDLDILPSNKRKWIYTNISPAHILHQIHTYIYIFNKIFIDHKLAQL